jgi:GT2 family glycosyltransferase
MDMVYILLPVHNRREVTRRFVRCLKAQTYKHYHLVLIDDGSNDNTAGMVREEVSSLNVITGRGGWWWAGSLQQGYLWLKRQKISSSDIVLIINNDTEFEADFIEQAVSILKNEQRMLLLAQCYSRHDGRLLDSGVHVDWQELKFTQAAVPEEINCLSTRGLFLRMKDFLSVGGFHPVLLPHYFSDYEFTIRAGCAGMRLVCSRDLRILLDEGTTGVYVDGTEALFVLLRKLFSKRSAVNPWYYSVFIALACPLRLKVRNLWQVWLNTWQMIHGAAARSKQIRRSRIR